MREERLLGAHQAPGALGPRDLDPGGELAGQAHHALLAAGELEHELGPTRAQLGLAGEGLDLDLGQDLALEHLVQRAAGAGVGLGQLEDLDPLAGQRRQLLEVGVIGLVAKTVGPENLRTANPEKPRHA